MTIEYALTKDGVTISETRRLKRPPSEFKNHPTRSAWRWLVVSRETAKSGQEPGWSLDIDAGTATFRTEFRPYVPRKVGTFNEFMDLLTPAQQSQVDIAAVPGSPLSILMKRGMASDEVDLTSDRVIEAIDLLMQGGIATAEQGQAMKDHDFNAQS